MAADGLVELVEDRPGGDEMLGGAEGVLDRPQVLVAQHGAQRIEVGVGAQGEDAVEARVVLDPGPIDGEVTEGNSALEDDPALVNTAPEGDGWFFKMTIGDASQLEDRASIRTQGCAGRGTTGHDLVTEPPPAAAISAAARSSVSRCRAQIQTSTPSAASAIAQALPSPLLEAQTIALFPVIPRSMSCLPGSAQRRK